MDTLSTVTIIVLITAVALSVAVVIRSEVKKFQTEPELRQAFKLLQRPEKQPRLITSKRHGVTFRLIERRLSRWDGAGHDIDEPQLVVDRDEFFNPPF